MFNFDGFLLSLIYHHHHQFFLFCQHLLQNIETSTTRNTSTKIAVNRDQNRPTHISIKRVWQEINLQQSISLIAHVPYENRLRFIRKHLHELWSDTFQNTNVLQTK